MEITTKKMIVPYDVINPAKIMNGFLFPNFSLPHINSFIEVDSKKVWDTGRIVYTGVLLDKYELLDRLKKYNVFSGLNEENLLELLELYLSMIKNHKIGHCVQINSTCDFKFLLERI